MTPLYLVVPDYLLKTAERGRVDEFKAIRLFGSLTAAEQAAKRQAHAQGWRVYVMKATTVAQFAGTQEDA